MEINTIIVDDEKLARDLLKEFVSNFPSIKIVAECSKGADAVEQINELKPQLVFLDVQMPGLTGFDVLDEIEHEPFIIFSTAYDQYAIKAFEKDAIDYLLKPIDEGRFKVAIERAIERIEKQESNVNELVQTLSKDADKKYSSHVFVQKSEKLLNLPVGEIIHLEASGDYTILSTNAEQFLSSTGISKLEAKLDPDQFIRIHRSTIINIEYLTEIEKHFNGGLVVKMQNGKSFPVSRTYAKEIKKKVV